MFSWSGHTLTAAQHLNDIVDADFFRIEPAEPYATNSNEVVDVAQAEQTPTPAPRWRKPLRIGIAIAPSTWDFPCDGTMRRKSSRRS